jgi:hypothetical protein
LATTFAQQPRTRSDSGGGATGLAKDMAVRPVPTRRAGPAVARRAEVVAALNGRGLSVRQAPCVGVIAHASQCVKVATGASGSSRINATECVSAGGDYRADGGERSSPSQVWRRGIGSPA